MTTPGRPRIAALDVLRGFALCGVVLANISPIADVNDFVSPALPNTHDVWLGLLVYGSFFPIFSLLFGVGFALLFDSAATRVPRPRLVLLRRLIVLLAFGLGHLWLWSGDILTVYAVVGLLVLLPSTWLPRWAMAGLAVAAITTALATGGSRIFLVPGLFLLGAALVRYGVIEQIERSTRGPVLLGLIFAAGAAPALWLQQTSDRNTVGLGTVHATAGLLLAGVYVCTLLVLFRTPLRPALQAVFAPLGRMALTNYLTATLLVLAASHLLHLPLARSLPAVLLTAGAVLTIQWLWSTLWLRRYRQGPLEWLWRWAAWATWARRAPLRIPTS